MKKNLPAFIAILILGIFVGAAYFKTQFRGATYDIDQKISISPSPSPIPSMILVSGSTSPTITISPLSPTPNQDSSLPLTITSPSPDTTVNTPTIIIKGKTMPRADVSLNDKDLIADAAGNFSVNLTLDEGQNLIIVTAADDNGNAAEKEMVVSYEVQE